MTDSMNGPRSGQWSDTFEEALESEFRRARSEARRELAERFNQTLRRLRQFESEPEWARTLLAGTRPLTARAAFFGVGNGRLRFLGAHGAAAPGNIEDIDLDSAPAFRNAVESGEMVVALRSAGEISGPIAHLMGESPQQKCCLFPVEASGRVAAVLYAEPADLRAGAPSLELLANLAGAALAAALATSGGRASSNMVTIRSAARTNGQSGGTSDDDSSDFAGRPPGSFSGWAALSKNERELHLRAQRFARVRVAEMRLYRGAAVEAGRAEGSLYAALQTEIDAARQNFRDQFFSSCPSMVDYLHVELVRTLAQDDGARLGPGYPGPMA
ncbi:MAG: hypothetical protein ACRD9L_03640 [Bryobacteraceae bacterium]